VTEALSSTARSDRFSDWGLGSNKSHGGAGVYLRCAACGFTLPLGWVGPCPSCGGILECMYPPEALRCLERASSGGWEMNRYLPLLPVARPLPTLGEGGTPLLRSGNLARDLRLSYLFFKNEVLNPTGSFKDRGAVVAVSRGFGDSRQGPPDGLYGQCCRRSGSLLRILGASKPYPVQR